MTKRVTINQSVLGDAGAPLTAGNTYQLRDELAEYLKGRGVAVDAEPAPAATIFQAGNAGAANLLIAGDSMSDHAEWGTPVTTVASYNSATGVITCTSTNHYRATGDMARVWNFNYPSLYAARHLPITRVDANTFTVTLADKPQDIPNGAMTASLFFQIAGCMNWTHPLGLAQLRLGHRLRVVFNGAQNGDTSVNMLARLPALLAAYPTTNVVYMQLLGLNDQSSANAFAETTTIAANRRIIDTIVQSGRRLILVSTTPVATGETGSRDTAAAMQRIVNINNDARDYSQQFGSVAWIDAHAKIVDPTSATGLAVATNLRSTDKIHYAYKGGALVQPDVAAVLDAWFPTGRSTLPASLGDCQISNKLTIVNAVRQTDGVTVIVNTTGAHGWRAGDPFRVTRISTAENGVFTVAAVISSTSFTYLLPGTAGALSAGSAHYTRSTQAFGNPLLLTATGGTTANGVTGTVASLLKCSNQAGATGTLTAAASVAASTDGSKIRGVGNEQLLVVTAGAANDRPVFSNAGSTTLLNDLVLNRLYRFECRFRMASSNWTLTPISELYGFLTLTWSTGELYALPFASGWDGAEAPTIASDQDWHLRSAPISTTPPQAGATLTGADFLLYPKISAALTGTLTLGLSRVGMPDVT